ncbi:MAG: AMP-binding protein [Phycisphaeraceae bacterium]
MTLTRTILGHALRAPRRVAVIDDQATYSYARLAAASFFLASRIERETRAKHVGLMLPTSGVFPAALLATWLLGRVAVPLNYLLSRAELHHVIHDADIDTILTVGPMLEYVGGRDAIPGHINIVELSKDDFKGIPRPRWPRRPDPDDLAVLLYTSGTSGKPKGVMLSHRNLEADVTNAITHANLKTTDTFLGVLPQFHSFGLTALTLLPLHLRAPVVYTARFVPRKIVQLIREHRPGVLMAVPSMYAALLSVKDASPDDFQSVRLPISGGEPLPDDVATRCRERFNLHILEGYGLTETAPITHWSTPTRKKPHAVGTPLPDVDVMIVDDNDQPLGLHEDGEIILAGPNVMLGYYKLPKETGAAIQHLTFPGRDEPQRAFRTGDIGHVDDEGFLFITGRKKEMLIIGGENVFPREIEEALNRHPAVRASGVVGKADATRGEVPVAYVELEDDQTVDPGDLRQHCREHIAAYKVPREIHVVTELPRSPTGKILRRKLGQPQ